MIPCKAVWSDIELSETFNLFDQAILATSRTPIFTMSVSLGINSSALTMCFTVSGDNVNSGLFRLQCLCFWVTI